MYIPSPHRESDVSELRRFVRANPLCTLVTLTGQNNLIGSHIPFILHEEGESGFGVLRGHVARGNPQWRDLSPNVEALAIFTGPQHFISASWYPSKTTHGRVVPTWNYIAVHAYGRLRVFDDPNWLLPHLKSLVDENEAIMEKPWSVSDGPPDFIANQMGAIVGVEINVARVEGKWKVSQNRTEEDAAGVVTGLRELKTPESDMMAKLVQERHPRKPY